MEQFNAKPLRHISAFENSQNEGGCFDLRASCDLKVETDAIDKLMRTDSVVLTLAVSFSPIEVLLTNQSAAETALDC